MTKEDILDRAIQSSPSASYLGAFWAGVDIHWVVAALTGVLVTGQIYKLYVELRDRSAARKEAKQCPSSKD